MDFLNPKAAVSFYNLLFFEILTVNIERKLIFLFVNFIKIK